MRKERFKRKVCYFSSFLILCLVLYSCLQDEWDIDSHETADQVVEGKNRELTVGVARSWYETSQAPVVATRSVVTNFELMTKMRWKKAYESRKGKFEVVEIPLLTRGGAVLLDKETKEKYNPATDRKKIRSIARMVIIKNLETGEITNFVMYIIGTYDYLKKAKHFGKNSYLHRDSRFSGSICFYRPEGGLVNGWKYENGKIVGGIKQGTEVGLQMQSAATTRGTIECYFDDVLVEYNECEGFEYYDPEYGPGFGTECHTSERWEVREICKEYEHNDPWYPSGGGGSGSGGGGSTGGGNTGGAGGYEPSIAPKAKAIFRNSSMTEANWKVIERMLDKIMEDCMGQALYNGLKSALDGKTLIVQFTNKEYSAFTVNGDASSISIGTLVESNVFFHEMWHAYQAYHESSSSYKNSLINQDIEAHYAQYLYLRKLPEYAGSKWENYYAKDLRHRSIKNLSKYIDAKGNLSSYTTNEKFDFNISSIASIFETTPGYDDPDIYKYDINRSGLSNFSNLRTLTKGC
ncbi:hypothetical protein [Bacteroides thetaiotaomicron]|uniref:hypothetical protein n=1 Tax=Bacteroides thetaiotaomicron TaxID=818 RepID=UPI00321BE6E2